MCIELVKNHKIGGHSMESDTSISAYPNYASHSLSDQKKPKTGGNTINDI